MGLNDTPSAERVNIAFFGCTNAGKSSLVNAVTGQSMSVVSNVSGTTTDAVKKAMELLPIGPVLIIDTPGFDDNGILGEKRIAAAKKVLHSCDAAVLVSEADRELNETEKILVSLFNERKIPFVIAKNKSDIAKEQCADYGNIVYTSALESTGIESLKKAISDCVKDREKTLSYVGDLIQAGDIVVLVTPIDSAAPKGRMILPQQQAIRDILDFGATAVVTKETELEHTLKSLSATPSLVITDSQVFSQVDKLVPDDIALTSFSILMARYRGILNTAVQGVKAIDRLKDGSRVLISEGCTHHRQCDDIGTVKLPNLLKNHTNADLVFDWSSGNSFPEELGSFDIVIHCGGCMQNDNEMKYRMQTAVKQGVPFTNYGIAIAYMKNILHRSIAPIPDISL